MLLEVVLQLKQWKTLGLMRRKKYAYANSPPTCMTSE